MIATAVAAFRKESLRKQPTAVGGFGNIFPNSKMIVTDRLYHCILENKLLLGIFFLGLFLRLFGIWHGWPFIYNVDEPALVRSAVGIRFGPNPHHFDWPHLHFYLTFGVLAFAYLVRVFFQVSGLRPLVESFAPFFWQDPAVYYLITRIFNASLGALTVVPVYLIGKKLFNKRIGLFSALALAVVPFHVQNSHMATVDIPLTFWLAWSLYFSARVLKEGRRPPEALEKGGRWKNYILSGAFAGFAASTKYNGILVLFCTGLAHLGYCSHHPELGSGSGSGRGVRFRNKFGMILKAAISSREILKPVVSVLIALLFFLIGTPYALLDWRTFWSYEYPKGVLWQFLDVGQVGSWAAFFTNGRKVLVEFFPSNLSLPFFMIVIGSFVEFLLLQKSAELALLFFFPILYSLLVIRGIKFSQHYFLPIYPFLVLLIGRFVAKISRISSEQFKNIRPFLFALIFLPALISSVRQDLVFARVDTRTMASHWVDEEIRSGRVGAIIGMKDIEIVKDGVSEDHIKNLGVMENFEKYDFIIVTETTRVFAVEKLSPKGFSLVEEFSSAGRRGPDILIFRRK